MVGRLLQNSTTHIIIFNKIYLHSTTHIYSTSTFPIYIQQLYLFNFTEIYFCIQCYMSFLYSTLTHELHFSCNVICIQLLSPYLDLGPGCIHSFNFNAVYLHSTITKVPGHYQMFIQQKCPSPPPCSDRFKRGLSPPRILLIQNGGSLV